MHRQEAIFLQPDKVQEMSKALKNLSRSLVGTPQEISKLFAYMKTDSARGAVASMSSLIEEALADAIKKRLVPLTDERAGTVRAQTFSTRGLADMALASNWTLKLKKGYR